MENKAYDMCPRCKYCLGMTPQGMYSCGKANDGLELNIGIDVILNCANFEWKDGKVEGKAKILSEEEYNELKKSRDNWRDRYYEVRYALRKDEQLDESISSTDIPSDVEMIEDLKKRAADSDYYKEKSELLEESRNAANRTSDLWKERCYKREEELKNANELADSWKRDYERLRDQFIYPMYNILYPDKPDLDINVTDFINDVKNLKVEAEENETMYNDLKYWKERCHKAEKDVEIKRLKKEIVNIGFGKAAVKDIIKKNAGFKQTISDQEVTIKALLITIKEMCKEDETNA